MGQDEKKMWATTSKVMKIMLELPPSERLRLYRGIGNFFGLDADELPEPKFKYEFGRLADSADDGD